jgi:hypothetical protein
MSRAAASTESIGAGKGALAALVVVGTALALLLIVRARPAPDPFDPRSSSADGATGLVELLERSDGEVTIGRIVPAPGTDTRLFVLVDQLGDEQRSLLIRRAPCTVGLPLKVAASRSPADNFRLIGSMLISRPTCRPASATSQHSNRYGASMCPRVCCSRSGPPSRSVSGGAATRLSS